MLTTNQSENNDKSSDGNYKTQFIELSAIGSGGFGIVFKVKHRLDDKIYAVKKVQFGDFCEEKKQKVLKEVKSLAKLDSEYVVKYYNSWLESNHLFIQMEFCSQSLQTIIKDKPIVFERQPEDHMNKLLECVQYLHSSDPPVIHRDLKPDNILITNNFRSNRCVKLCDFGLATEHDPKRHTASRYVHSFVGTFRYIAPEVYTRRKYNHKSDIFSLSLIGEDIFSVDLQPSTSFSGQESLFNSSLICLYKTLQSMMNYEFRERPECREVLAKHNEWSIDKSVVTNYKEFNSDKLKFGGHYGHYRRPSAPESMDYPDVGANDDRLCTALYGQPDGLLIGSHTLTLTSDGRVYAWEYAKILTKNQSENNDKSINGNYKTQFMEMSAISLGGFGIVFKVKHKLDDKIYAVKKVQFGDCSEKEKQKVLKEVKTLSKLNSDFVVKYYNSWSEGKHVFIHMEYCCQTLGDVIKDKVIVFGRQSSEAMNLYEYFISCEILRELLQCLQYIHDLNPPVIHRDLKPANVLIVNIANNNRFLKLCDFGVAVEHNMVSMSHTSSVGTSQYMAPEIFQSRYTTKVDIYSLAVISYHLFDLFNIDKPQEVYGLTTFSANFHKLYQIIKQMSLGLADDRPTSGQFHMSFNNFVSAALFPRLGFIGVPYKESYLVQS
ncbi:unnamed protein product, partial [Medioppia subpectinata]